MDVNDDLVLLIHVQIDSLLDEFVKDFDLVLAWQ